MKLKAIQSGNRLLSLLQICFDAFVSIVKVAKMNAAMGKIRLDAEHTVAKQAA